MNIIFDNVKITNFLSFATAEVDLKNRNIVAVRGVNNNEKDAARSNGSGKSTIFNAICWALTGETINGVKDICNIYADDGAIVELNFKMDNNEYKIVRSKNHSVYKTNLKVYVNNEDKSGKGIKDSEKLLSEYLPDITAEFIGSVMILGQGLPHKFTDNTPAGRKELLEKLFKSDFMIADLKSRIDARKSELNITARTISDNIIASKAKIDACKIKNLRTQKLLDETLAINITDLNDKLNQHTQSLEKYNAEKAMINEELSTYIDNQTDMNTTISELNNKFVVDIASIDKQYADKLADMRSKLIELQTSISSITAEINRIKNIKDTCPTCGQKLIGVEKPSTEPLEAELSTLNAEYNTVNQLNIKITAEKDSKITEYKNNNSTALAKCRNDLTAITNNITIARNKLIEIDNNISTINSAVNVINNTINGINSKIKMYEDELTDNNSIISAEESLLEVDYGKQLDVNNRLDIINKFTTVITRDFRGYLLSGIIDSIEQRLKYYSTIVFNNDSVEFALNGNNIDVKIQGKNYSSLSGGEKQKVDLMIQFTLRDMLCKYLDFSCNILVLDEVMDFIDVSGCSNVINLIQDACQDVSSTFIISHHSDLDLPYDNELTVVKDNTGFSYVL